MDIDTQLRILLAIILVIFITYTITRDYYVRILKLQHEYIKDLQKETQILIKIIKNFMMICLEHSIT